MAGRPRLAPVLAAAAAAAAPVLLAAGCAELAGYTKAAVEQRRLMNDIQARLSLLALCDVSLGAFYRELTADERELVAGACGGLSGGKVVIPGEPPASPETAAEPAFGA